ncbi:hypothetical protein sos41_15700 [Alphaproteobacteria bacterium SO-S41]|nr:hypothetical protein sos41_15700 [Alphaproteobacteria bacterium SO-S41]
MKKLSFAKLTLGCLALGGAPALADALPEPAARTTAPVIGFFDAAKPHCYVREYDKAHMVAHPKQKVTAIAFSYQPTQTSEGQEIPMWDQYADTPAFSAMMVVTFRNEKRTGFGSAYCKAGPKADVLNCGIDGDGGSFTLTAKADGKFRIDNPTGFTVAYPSKTDDEPDEGYEQIDPKDDQDSFLLSDAKGGLCDKEWKAD